MDQKTDELIELAKRELPDEVGAMLDTDGGRKIVDALVSVGLTAGFETGRERVPQIDDDVYVTIVLPPQTEEWSDELAENIGFNPERTDEALTLRAMVRGNTSGLAVAAGLLQDLEVALSEGEVDPMDLKVEIESRPRNQEAIIRPPVPGSGKTLGLDGRSDLPKTPWMEMRDEWVKNLSDSDIGIIAVQINKDGSTDENDGDRAETQDALTWLHSRGDEGEEFGIVARAAKKLGLLEA